MEIISGIFGFIVFAAIALYVAYRIDKAKSRGISEGFELGRRAVINHKEDRNSYLFERLEELENEQKVLREEPDSVLEEESPEEEKEEIEVAVVPEWLVPFPDDLMEALNNLTVREATERNIITDIGLNGGDVFHTYSAHGDIYYYAIFNSYGFRISQQLIKRMIDEEDVDMQDLMFSNDHFEYENNSKLKFHLCLPHERMGANELPF